MGKRFKRRTKPIILIILICFVSINVFPYDIIGIEKNKQIGENNEGASTVDILLRLNLEEELGEILKCEYQVVKKDIRSRVYLLRVTENDYKSLKDNNLFKAKERVILNDSLKGEYIYSKGVFNKKHIDYKYLIAITSLLLVPSLGIYFKKYISDNKEIPQYLAGVIFTMIITLFQIIYQATTDKQIESVREERTKDMFDKFYNGFTIGEISAKEPKRNLFYILSIKNIIISALLLFVNNGNYFINQMDYNEASFRITPFLITVIMVNSIINDLSKENIYRIKYMNAKETDKDIFFYKGIKAGFLYVE